MIHKRLLLLMLILFLSLGCSCSLSEFPIGGATSTAPRSIPTTSPQLTTIVSLPSATGAPFNINWDDRSPFEKNLSPSSLGILSGLPGASIYHIAFYLSDPPTQVNGLEEIRYINTENVDLTEVDFAVFSEILGGSITINALSLNGQPVSAEHQNGIMRVPLPEPLHPNESVTFHIEFVVTVPAKGGNYYYGIFGYNDSILSLAHAYPTILVYNDQGWNNQVPDLDGDPLFSDTSFYLVSVNAPKSLTLVASGVEIEHLETANRQQVLYADGPARDFYLVASSDFHKRTGKAGDVTVNSYTLPRLDAYAQSALETAEAAIEDFSQRYAPYPYSEFDIAPIETSAGGVEFPGMTVVATDVFGAGNFLEVVVTHEVGHQWFYNLVGNETQQQPWLDESLAEFVTWQYYLDVHGQQGAQEYQDEMHATWDSLNDEKIPIGMPVSSYTSQEYVAIVYGRGPFFFLALRQQIGQQTFDNLMHNYTQTFAWKIATADDLKQLSEKQCGCNLTPLFAEWVTP
jgi:hypothetical protein